MPLVHRREKELASDRRAGWTARTSIRERHRQTVRAHWRPLALLAAALLVVFGVAGVFANGPLQRGIIVGTGVTLTARRRGAGGPDQRVGAADDGRVGRAVDGAGAAPLAGARLEAGEPLRAQLRGPRPPLIRLFLAECSDAHRHGRR
jgi:hypothetical protein